MYLLHDLDKSGLYGDADKSHNNKRLICVYDWQKSIE